MVKHTFRGTLPAGFNSVTSTDALRLHADNGMLTENHVVTRFEVYGNARSNPQGYWLNAINNDDITYVTVALDEDGLSRTQTFEDNRQIGWFAASGEKSIDNFHLVLDPHHLVVNDLWIGAYAIDTSDGSIGGIPVEINYLIELCPEKTSENQAVLGLIKERAQDDLD